MCEFCGRTVAPNAPRYEVIVRCRTEPYRVVRYFSAIPSFVVMVCQRCALAMLDAVDQRLRALA